MPEESDAAPPPTSPAVDDAFATHRFLSFVTEHSASLKGRRIERSTLHPLSR